MALSARFRRLFHEGFWIVAGQAMAVIGSLVGVRWMTGLLSPEAYVELALGMTVATLVNQSLLGPLGNGAARFYAPAIERGDGGGYWRALRRLLWSVTGTIVFAIPFVAALLIITGHTAWVIIVVLAFLFAILTGWNATLGGIQNAARQRPIVSLRQGMESWARFLAAVAMLLWFGATSTVAMAGFALAALAILGSQAFFFRRIIPREEVAVGYERVWRDQVWRFSWPFAIFGVFTWMQLVSDRWALELFSTTKDVGLYAALFQLGYTPMSLATAMAIQFLAPIFYQRAGDASDKGRNADVNRLSSRLTIFSLGLTALVVLLAFMFHGKVFKLFAAEEYGAVSYLLPWMLLSGGLFAAGQTMALNLMSQMKTLTMATPKIMTALLGVLLNFIGAYWYGLPGIVMAGILFSSCYFLWMVRLSKYLGMKNIFLSTDDPSHL